MWNLRHVGEPPVVASCETLAESAFVGLRVEHRRGKGEALAGHAPDFSGVLDDGAIGGEFGTGSDVFQTHLRPAVLVLKKNGQHTINP